MGRKWSLERKAAFAQRKEEMRQWVASWIYDYSILLVAEALEHIDRPLSEEYFRLLGATAHAAATVERRIIFRIGTYRESDELHLYHDYELKGLQKLIRSNEVPEIEHTRLARVIGEHRDYTNPPLARMAPAGHA